MNEATVQCNCPPDSESSSSSSSSSSSFTEVKSKVMDQESPTANPSTFSDDMSTAEVSAWLKSQGIPEQYCKAFEGTFLARKLSALLAQSEFPNI